MTEPETTFLIESDDIPSDHRSGFVAVLGKPNVGKSTLLNALLGEKIAIVSKKPQTTRTRILGIVTRPAAQAIFIDTPGIHKPRHRLGAAMVKTALSAIPDADVLLFIVDATHRPDADDQHIAKLIRERGADQPTILVLNKMDRLDPKDIQTYTQAHWALAPTPEGGTPPQPWEWMMISALRGDNLTKLVDAIVERLPNGPLYYPPEQITDQYARDIAAELVREQALNHLHQEVPHAVAVLIEEYSERSKTLDYISATIVVERDSQKGILIGKGGRTLRQIGADARHQIEHMLEKQVFLELRVKVRKNWRENEGELKRMGYSE